MAAEQSDQSTWLTSLVQNGLPGVLLGSFGKHASEALGRLIFASADIPVAWLERHSSRIRDDHSARAKVTSSLADAVAKRAAVDPHLLDRMEARWVSGEERKQKNREGVARKAIAYLESEAPSPDGGAVNEDFMNRIEAGSQDASSEEMQDLFARILAGEIRKPGTFSLATVQVISIMDQKLAAAVQATKALVNHTDWIPLQGALGRGQHYRTMRLLGEYGLLHLNPSSMTLPDDKDVAGYIHGDRMIFVKWMQGAPPAYSAWFLTTVGREIFSLVESQPTEEQMGLLVDSYRAHNVTKIETAFIKKEIGSDNVVMVWNQVEV